MATIKCVVTYPAQLISNIGEFEINSKEAETTIEEEGKLKVIRENVIVFAMLHVFGLMYGPENAICYMDVFVDDVKVNSDEIKSVFKESGVQLFNWNAS